MCQNLFMSKWILAAVTVVAMVSGAVLFSHFRGSSSSNTEVDWRLLGEMDYISNKASVELQSLDQKKVKIPGFVVPLEDNMQKIEEFLLVPTPQACIHVPPPPPNQMVYVKMKTAENIPMGPVWIYGTLHLVTKNSMYGDSSFELIGDRIEVYK